MNKQTKKILIGATIFIILVIGVYFLVKGNPFADAAEQVKKKVKGVKEDEQGNKYTDPDKTIDYYECKGDSCWPLKKGMKDAPDSDTIQNLQQALNKKGANLKGDGVFGPATEQALERIKGKTQLSKTEWFGIVSGSIL